jgi:hypothetical protein
MSLNSHWLSADTDTEPTWPVWLLPDTSPEEASPLDGLARHRRYGYNADEPSPSPLRMIARDRRPPRSAR